MRDSAIRISVLNQIFSSFRHWKLKAKITFLEVLYLRACAFILKMFVFYVVKFKSNILKHSGRKPLIFNSCHMV